MLGWASRAATSTSRSSRSSCTPVGRCTRSALNAMGRNPEAEGTLRTYMFLGFALTEALFIFALVISLLIAFNIV